MSDYKIRLTVDLDEEEGMRLRKNLDWGEQGHIFRKIVSQLNDFTERYGKTGIAMFMTDKLSLLDILSQREREKDGLKRPKAKPARTSKRGSSQADIEDQSE